MPKRNSPARPVNLADPPAFATVQEACKTLAVSRSTLGRWIDAGRLDVVHVGRSVRVKVASIVALTA